MELFSFFTVLIGLFLIFDSLSAIIFKKRYMLWGLEYTPALYRNFIKYLSGFPPNHLQIIKIIEMAIGLTLLYFGIQSK